MPKNVDQQVLQSFHDEVRASLPDLKKYLENLAKNPKRKDALKKAHGLVQGLAGTASIIGLANWSETGSMVGHFLNEVVAGEQAMTADAAAELRATLDHIEAELDSPPELDPPRFELEDVGLDLSLEAPDAEMLFDGDEPPRFELLDDEDSQPATSTATKQAAVTAEELPEDEIADPEIVEVFQEEAEELIGLIASTLRTLKEEPGNREALQDVRRAMHTIKGAAGMVGLRCAQRIAHRSEDVLDHLYESQTPVDDQLIELLQTTADLVQDIAESASTSEETRSAAIVCCAQYDTFVAGPHSNTPSNNAASVADEKVESSESEPLKADQVGDAELLEVFQEEAEEHIGLLAANLRKLHEEASDRDTLQEVRRSMHTIKGAAGMVGLHSAQRIAHTSEDLLDHLYESEIAPTPALLDLLQRTADVVQDIASSGGADDSAMATVAQLVDEYKALRSEHTAAVELPELDTADFAVEVPLAASAPIIDLEADQPCDAELLEVFQEEAEEHLGLIAKNLRVLREDPSAREELQEVRRSMHTIKGAAGMVGLRSAQRVAHRSEDLLDRLYDSNSSIDPAVLDLIQETADVIQTVTEASGADDSSRARVLELSARYEAQLATSPEQAVEPPEPIFEEPSVVEPKPIEQAIDVTPPPPCTPPKMSSPTKSASGQYARVPLERVEELVRLVSELIVSRSNFEQHCRRFTRESGELKLSGERLTQLTTKLETDYAIQAMADGSGDTQKASLAYAGGASAESFDSLEFDRYSEFHLLSRDLHEAADDISSAGSQLHGVAGDFQNSLVRLSRLTGEVQDGLMRLRMSPISSLENRLHRTVRVAAQACKKKVRLEIVGGEVELDKSILEEITGPLEHLLRNAVDHGIETPAKRKRSGKQVDGVVTLRAYLDGARAAIEVSDDGGGLDVVALRKKAVERGIHSERAASQLSSEETYELIFDAGFTTAAKVSEVSGRGVGMDVVRSAIESLNGSIGIQSETGQGSKFEIGLPTSLAVARVLMVESNSQSFAAPMHAIRQVVKIHPDDVKNSPEGEFVTIEGRRFKAVRLADVLNLPGEPDPDPDRVTAMIIDAGKRSFVLLADRVMEAAEVVVKNMGGLLRRVHGISAATISGDGSVVLILNPGQLVDPAPARFSSDKIATRDAVNDDALTVLVVDDSLSVRRVVTRLLEAAEWKTVVARDGLEALEALKEMAEPPDAILCDVEMPRMDGYELATNLKAGMYANIPMLMLTSRAGQKHRDRAKEIGVEDYLIKPFQDEALLQAIRTAVKSATTIS